MRAALRIAAFLLFASLAAPSAQAFISVTPANPVAGAQFVVYVNVFCVSFGDATVSGREIIIPVTPYLSCCATCVTERYFTVGPLPAGTYTVRLISTYNDSVIETLPVMVGGADIPALDPRLLAILAITLIAIAVLRLR